MWEVQVVCVSLSPSWLWKNHGENWTQMDKSMCGCSVAIAWQPPAVFSEALSWAFPSNFQQLLYLSMFMHGDWTAKEQQENLGCILRQLNRHLLWIALSLQFMFSTKTGILFSALIFFLACLLPVLCLVLNQVVCHCVKNCWFWSLTQ